MPALPVMSVAVVHANVHVVEGFLPSVHSQLGLQQRKSPLELPCPNFPPLVMRLSSDRSSSVNATRYFFMARSCASDGGNDAFSQEHG